ncbi:DMT family transporter [Acetobacterium bakii]|nr:DMT family transporter [Acetobacterium bakii]
MSPGIIAAISAALAAGTIPVLTKALMLDGFSPTTILFYRYAFVFAFLGLSFMSKKERIKLTKRQMVELIIFSVFGYGGATFLLAQSFNFMSMGLATMLYFSYPFFVVLIMGLVFKEKPNKFKITALVIAILGIICLMNFDFNLMNIGSILALGAGLTYGIYLVSLQKSSLQKLENSVTVFYLGGISALIFGLQGLLISGNLNSFMISPKAIVVTAVLGGITIFVLRMVTFAVKIIGPTQTSLIIAFEAVVTLILGIVLFHEPWNGNTVGGAILMLISVILVSRSSDSDIFSQEIQSIFTSNKR